MIQLSKHTVVALVDVTVATYMSLVSFVYLSVKTIASWLPESDFFNGPECPLPEVQAFQRLETDVDASDDGLSCLVLTVWYHHIGVFGHIGPITLASQHVENFSLS